MFDLRGHVPTPGLAHQDHGAYSIFSRPVNIPSRRMSLADLNGNLVPSFPETALFRLCIRALGLMPLSARATARMLGDPLSFLGTAPVSEESVAYRLPFHTLLLINDPDVAAHILAGNADDGFLPSPIIQDLLTPLAGNWSGETPLLPSILTAPCLPRVEEEATRTTNRAISGWLARNGQPTPVGADLFGLVLETISISLMGVQLNAETTRRFVMLQARAMQQAQILPFLLARDSSTTRAAMVHALGLARTGAELRALAQVHILPELAAQNNDAPLHRHLAEAGFLSAGKTDAAVEVITALLLFTSEGIAATLGWLVYELAHDQLLQEGAALALGGAPVLGGDADARFNGHPPEAVLRALVLETLRLHPPFGFMLRENARKQEICGQTVEAGASLVVSPRTLHRHRKLWSNPDTFAPERWLVNETLPTGKSAPPAISPEAFMPFGPHTFPLAAPAGEKIAMAVLTSVLCRFLSSTRLVLAGGPEPRALAHLSCRAEPDIVLRVLPRPTASSH